MSGKSPKILQEVIRDKKKEKKLCKHKSGKKSFSSYSHFYVKRIVIYSLLGIPFLNLFPFFLSPESLPEVLLIFRTPVHHIV